MTPNHSKQRRSSGGVLPLAAALAVMLGFVVPQPYGRGGSAWSQTPPAYSELFEDPPWTGRLTQADLPNLGRLVVLEATSMFVHARTEYSNSLESFRVLQQVNEVWTQADAFTAAVSFYRLPSQSIEAGRLVYPDLEAAFLQLRATLGRVPGLAPRTSLNLAYMSRVMAVIGPLLQQPIAPANEATKIASLNAAAFARAIVALQRAIGALENDLSSQASRGHATPALSREVDRLARLVQGFGQIAGGPADQRELVASFQPVRTQAQRVDREFPTAGLPLLETNLWRPIFSRIESIYAGFQLPREIVPRSVVANARPIDPATIEAIDQAARQVDTVLGSQDIAALAEAQRDAVVVDARRLQTRLYLARQGSLGDA
ncbi:MAG: hypothetical protein JO161_05550, partial [Planctomycetaceae bacterium]|nr:hypothetical protein [Planctomycetaceae bacterium]